MATNTYVTSLKALEEIVKEVIPSVKTGVAKDIVDFLKTFVPEKQMCFISWDSRSFEYNEDHTLAAYMDFLTIYLIAPDIFKDKSILEQLNDVLIGLNDNNEYFESDSNNSLVRKITIDGVTGLVSETNYNIIEIKVNVK